MAGCSHGQNKNKKNVDSWKEKPQTAKAIPQPKAEVRFDISMFQGVSKVNVVKRDKEQHRQFQSRGNTYGECRVYGIDRTRKCTYFGDGTGPRQTEGSRRVTTVPGAM